MRGCGASTNGFAPRLESLFKPAGSKQAIAENLRQLKAEKQVLRERTLAIETWIANKDQLAAALERKENLEAERSQLRQEESRLTSYVAAFPSLRAIRGFEEQLRPLAEVPLLPPDFGVRYTETIEALKIAQLNRDRHGEDAAKWQAASRPCRRKRRCSPRKRTFCKSKKTLAPF